MITDKKTEIINYIKSECKLKGVKVILRNTNYVLISGNIKCAGYFDSENKCIVVAMNHKISFETLLHEYCHFTQWREQCPEWINAENSLGKIDDWLSGKKIRNIKFHIDNAKLLELDNEKRTVDMIYEWGLEKTIDVSLYTKRANAYIMFYNWVLKARRWSKPGNSPYMNTKIVNIMSDKFDMNYDTLSPELEKIFIEEKI